MDSLTHLALGAALGTAVLGRRAGPRAALWGAACATLPDLDVLIAHGDPVRDFVLHRAETHSLCWLTLAAPLVACLPAGLHRRADRQAGVRFGHWWWLAWLTLVTHALLDAFTVYGTRLWLPFSDRPVGLGSIFIVDPLYTLPLVLGLVAARAWRDRGRERTWRWNGVGLAASSLYLAWTVVAQVHVAGQLRDTLAGTTLARQPSLVTPTPFNSLLWRVVVMDRGAWYEGYHSLLDDRGDFDLARHANATSLVAALGSDADVRRLAGFSRGFYGVSEAGPGLRVATTSVSSTRQLFGVVQTAVAAPPGDGPPATSIVMTDLRMGQAPWFVYRFVVAEHRAGTVVPVPARQVPTQRPPLAALAWLWHRIWDADVRWPY